MLWSGVALREGGSFGLVLPCALRVGRALSFRLVAGGAAVGREGPCLSTTGSDRLRFGQGGFEQSRELPTESSAEMVFSDGFMAT